MADLFEKVSSELAGVVPELWGPYFPTKLNALPFQSVVARDYQGVANALGDTVHVPTWPKFSPAAVTDEDGIVDADAVSVTNVDILINKQLTKDFNITNYAKFQSIEQGNHLRELAFFSILEKMEELIIAEISPSSSSPDHVIDYATPGTVALADFIAAKQLLDLQDVPDMGQRQAIGSPIVANRILAITNFISRDYIPAGSPMSTGSVATPLLGFQFKYTTKLADDDMYLFDPVFLQMVVQQNPTPAVYDMRVLGRPAMKIALTMLAGVKQIDNLRVVKLT